MRYAEQIKGLRLKLKLNQQQLAEKLLVSQGTVSRWEAGTQEPSKDVITRIQSLGRFDHADLVKDLGLVFSPSEWGREVFIKGQIALNKLVDTIEWPRDQWVIMTAPEVSAWSDYDLSAFLVSGYSDRTYADNSVVFVIPFEINRVEPKSGDKIVFAEKHERSGRYEVILAEFRETFEDEYVILSSPGLKLDFQAPFWDIVGSSGSFLEAGFIGLVVGGVMIESISRIGPRRRPGEDIREDE